VTLGFADITGLPYVLTALIAAGGIAVALATAAAALTALASSLGNDLFARIFARRASAGRRLIVTRLALIATAGLASWLAMYRADEIYAYAVAAPSVAAAGFFPALALGVFWKRTTFWGALFGMVAGGGATLGYVVMLYSGSIELLPFFGLTEAVSPAASAAFGVPIGLTVTILVSIVTPSPGLGRREVVDAIRRPSPDPILEDHAT
jgi:cation/acetate symporter